MDYIGGEKYWDENFASRPDKLGDTEPSLIDNIEYFKAGTVLDVACGDGRNALYLTGNGFKVTGIDFSSKALERLKSFAQRLNLTVITHQVDLNAPGSLETLGTFDNVIINHYRLSKENIKTISSHITEGGTLFVCGYGHRHKVDAKFRVQDLIQPTDFEDIESSFELVKYTENLVDGKFFVTYIFRKTNR
ncbi:class I SAM-dependent methyltransferase [Clostridium prolinivorans]|uniref:class I SAM-dependent methyltransferase n=1 Tax=Clostridium prolinivorans TaxID=2769420 RepID=UPI000FDA3C54|nr:class I SAM-dependent methyltransferase [Clostridium prolinivorans]